MKKKEVNYDTLKQDILTLLERDWGPRCKTKDIDDFDDLITVGDPESGRCPCCLVYEKFDNFWSYFDYESRGI